MLTSAHARAPRFSSRATRCVGVEFARDGARRAGVRARARGRSSAPGRSSRRGCCCSRASAPADRSRHVSGSIRSRSISAGVGQNLHDHRAESRSSSRPRGPSHRRYPASSRCTAHLFWRSRAADLDRPRHPAALLPPPALRSRVMQGPADGFTLMGRRHPTRQPRLAATRLGRPRRRPPLIDPACLAMRRTTSSRSSAAVELCREIGRTARARGLDARASSIRARRPHAAASLRDYVRQTAITYHHQVGTCTHGRRRRWRSSTPQLRVRGVEGLARRRRLSDAVGHSAATRTRPTVDDRRARVRPRRGCPRVSHDAEGA